MLVDPDTMPDDMRQAYEEYENYLANTYLFRTYDCIGLDPGEYYLCIDSGKIVRQEPDCKYRIIVVEKQCLLPVLCDEDVDEILRRTHRAAFPEDVWCVPEIRYQGILPRYSVRL